ncbi:MAG: hypothetical protein IJC84_03100 [Clostridia bacterium]|nr:hypothetical protein [Clostridia bacterium]
MKYKIRKELFSFSCLKPPIASVHMVGWLGLKMKRTARCTVLMQWKKPPSVRMPLKHGSSLCKMDLPICRINERDFERYVEKTVS